jgi:hypothetical protein
MAKWLMSKGVQATIAFVFALLAVLLVVVNRAMNSFNNFYFAPHKAYPYPYPTEGAARIALWQSSCLTFFAVFTIVYIFQRLFNSHRNSSTSV